VRGRPYPPDRLARRVGDVGGHGRRFHNRYDAVGRASRDTIVAHLPSDWNWEGKRVLDFGCGAGRTLRHFQPEAGQAEFVGCDIDAESIGWVNSHLSGTARGVVSGEWPPLPFADDSFDLVYALSVFTHLTDSWSAWLLELRRVLAPGGLLIASFLGEGMSSTIAREAWDEDRIGMNVLLAHRPWHRGGPMVMLSPWWIREHWGRAFAIESIDDGAVSGAQGLVVARPAGGEVTAAELEHVDLGEPRELMALRHNVQQLRAESAALEREYEGSVSWRLTSPMRRVMRLIRLRRDRRRSIIANTGDRSSAS
jgi:SAM-dependent methyltransferase